MSSVTRTCLANVRQMMQYQQQHVCNMVRVHWSEALLSLAPTHEELSSAGQVLFRGLSAKIGIFHGLIARLSPHGVTGVVQALL